MTELRNALVTGATSFLGAALVRRLLAEGWGCRVIVRPESRGLAALPVGHPGLRVIRGDCGAPEDWQAEVQGCECFFHFAWDGIGAAGRADVGIQRRNVEMAKACLRAAAAEGCGRFVFAGSQAEYGVCDGEITEATPCAPRIEYGRGKLAFLQAAEEMSKSLGIEYVHLRIFSVYGPGDHPWTLVSRCLEAFRKGEAMELSPCTQDWNFLYTGDAADAIRRFGDCPLGGETVFNVAGEETRPLREYVEMMRKVCGGGEARYGQLAPGGEPVHGIRPNIRRMQEATGWKQETDFESGIRKTLEAEFGSGRRKTPGTDDGNGRRKTLETGGQESCGHLRTPGRAGRNGSRRRSRH